MVPRNFALDGANGGPDSPREGAVWRHKIITTDGCAGQCGLLPNDFDSCSGFEGRVISMQLGTI